MKGAQHTPGPWVPDAECGLETVLGADGAMVADCAIFGASIDRPDGTCRANARLIAAAPRLLAELSAMVAKVDDTGLLIACDTAEAVLVRARAAIAEATGGAA